MPAPARQFGVLGRAALWAEASADPELLFGFPEKSPGPCAAATPLRSRPRRPVSYIIAGTAMTPWLWLDPLNAW
jgi:hypothetical protein